MITRLTSFLPLLALLLAAFAFTACRSSDISTSPGEPDPIPAPENDPIITILAPELRPWLGFHSPIVNRDPDHPLRVEQPMRNMVSQRYFIQYRILFYTADNLESPPTMPWRRIFLEPKQTIRLTGSATSLDADHYRIEIKWAK